MTFDKFLNTLQNPDMWVTMIITILTIIMYFIFVRVTSEIIYEAKYKEKLNYKKKLMELKNDKI